MPSVFYIHLEWIMRETLENHTGTVCIGGRNITNLRFADDIDGIAGKEAKLANLVRQMDRASSRYGKEISAEKTKLMANNNSTITANISVQSQKLERVQISWSNNLWLRIQTRNPHNSCTMTTLVKLKTIWRDKNITLKYRSDFYVHCFFPSSFTHVKHRPSLQSYRGGYKRWKWDATVTSWALHTKTMSQMKRCAVQSTTTLALMKTSQQWKTRNSNGSATSQDLVASQRPFFKEQWRGREAEETIDGQQRGMDRETISWDPGTGTQLQQMEETGAQLVKIVPWWLHCELRELKIEEDYALGGYCHLLCCYCS